MNYYPPFGSLISMGESKVDKIQEELEFFKGNLLVLAVSSGIWRFTSNLISPFYPLYVLALGGTYFSIGIIAAVGGALSIVPTLAGGYLADKRGRKKIVALLTIMQGPVKLIKAFAPHWTFLLIATAINSIFSGLRGPAFSAIMADSLKPENRGKGYGIWASIPVIPALFSPAIGGWLITQMGLIKTLRIGYVLVAIGASTAGFLRLFFLRETFEGKKGKASLKESVSSLIKVGKNFSPGLKALLLLSMMSIFGWGIKRRFRVTYAVEVIGLSPFLWGIIFTLARVVRITLLPFLGHSVDKIGRRILAGITLIIIPIMDILFVFSFDFFTAFFTFTFFYVSRHVRGTARKALRADLSPKEKRGKIYSLFRVCSRPTRKLGPLVGGILYNYSKRLPFFAEALLSLASFILLIFFIKEPKKEEREA